MKTTAYQCPICKTLYATEEECKTCEKECREEAKENAEAAELERNRKALLDMPRLTATSWQHLIALCRETALKLWDVELDFTLAINYGDCVSNTHSAPIGKPTNWERNKKLPTGYPGFYGRISGTVKHLSKKSKYMSGSDFFAGSFGRGFRGVNTGTGGGVPKFSYDVSLYLEDFPLIVEKFKADEDRLNCLEDDARACAAKQQALVEADADRNRMQAAESVLEQQIKNLQSGLAATRNKRFVHEQEITKELRSQAGDINSQIVKIRRSWQII